jgi:hypothetical protein
MDINVSKLVNSLLSDLDSKQRDILDGRYGLKDGNPKTLAELGEKYQITRERVRQIEAGALKQVRAASSKTGVKDFVALVKSHLKNLGGIRRWNLLIGDIKLMIADSNASNLDNKVRFLLDVAGEPHFSPEDDNFYSCGYLSEEERKLAENFISKLVKFMKENRSDNLTHRDMDTVFNKAIKPHNLKDLVALNYISVSKNFHINQFGDFGLSDDPFVNPKTMRDWAYAVLRKRQKPAHFGEIAKMINKIRKDASRLAHPQTVHNELIKDERFVLVGRGTYGLQDFGLIPGTAREVMARVLKEHGPLEPKELLGLVLKERVLKKNTVLINLRNSKYFKRLDDGRYAVITV